MPSPSPAAILTDQVALIRRLLPRIRDGEVEAIHDARVATRRVREVLPLAQPVGRHRSRGDLGDQFADVGRLLGAVRDLDVSIGLLVDVERRLPHAAGAVIGFRHDLERRRGERVRHMIKRFERRQIAAFLDDVAGNFVASKTHWWTRERWRDQLHERVVARAKAAVAAVDHATGVYFPNRTHRARIALKKLRYASELAEATGFDVSAATVRELRKAQDLLGDVHDRQIVVDGLADPARASAPESALTHAVVQLLEAEMHALHGRYVARRVELLETCRLLAAPPAEHSAIASAPVVTAGAISAIWLWRIGARRLQRSGGQDAGKPTDAEQPGPASNNAWLNTTVRIGEPEAARHL